MKRVEFNRDFIFVLLVFVATSTLSNALLALNTRVQYISSAISGRGFPRFGQRQLLKQPHSLQSFASRYATAAVVADATRSSTWWRSKALLTKDLFSATAFIVSPSARKRAPVAPAAATTRLGEWLLGFGAVVAYQSGRLRSTVSPLFQHVKGKTFQLLLLLIYFYIYMCIIT